MEFILKGGKPGPGKGGKGADAGAMIGGAAGAGELIKDTDTAHFVADVIEASRTVPVILDLWAPWCGPCKQLGPLLEKLVRAANGAVRLVKLNVDENQGIAAQLRVQSIPAVFAFGNGALVDGFVGALPESQIKAFIERLTGGKDGGGLDEAVAEARALLDAGDLPAAEDLFRQILEHDPGNVGALAGVLRCFVARGDTVAAKDLLGRLPPDLANKPEIAAVRTMLELAEQAPGAGAVLDLARKLAGNPDDHQTRHDLALAYYAAGQREKAVDELLEIVRRDRTWNEDGGRKQLIKLFDAFGPTDPLTLSARRRLSALLFS